MLFPIGSFLDAAAAPLARKVLAGLGIGVLSFTVIQTLLDTLIGMAQAAYSGITGFAAAIIGLAGFGEAFGIIGGALVAGAIIGSGKSLGVVK
jgi:Protein of unknown function (DUF2523)